MSVNLQKLSQPALSAAMRGGTEGWGEYGSINEHVLYAEPQNARHGHYLKCRCGCGKKAKWRLMANGLCMMEGCEFSVRRSAKPASPPQEQEGGG